MNIHLHNPFITLDKAETRKIEQIQTPLSYEQKIKDDRKATIFLFVIILLSAVLSSIMH